MFLIKVLILMHVSIVNQVFQ